MTTHETVRPVTQGQFRDIAATMIGAIPDLSFEDANQVIGGKGNLVAGIQELFARFKSDAKSLLELLTTIILPATTRFIARDHFKVDISPEAPVQIAYLGDNFKNHFLGKVEENVPEARVRIHRLIRPSLDAPIVAALGEKHEAFLAHLHQLLLRQPKGEQGDLLTDGYANIFYVRDAGNTLWAVGARWCGGGWRVDANSVGSPREWRDDDQVIACDS